MASPGFNPNHYQTLGISLNATSEDIRKAFYQQARQFHPDKNPHRNAEEWMKRINEAYQVLSNEVERADYNEHMEDESDRRVPRDPVASLPQGRRFSEDFKKQFRLWMNTNLRRVMGLGHFQRTLQKGLNEFLQGPFRELRSNTGTSHQQTRKFIKPSESLLEEFLNAAVEKVDSPSPAVSRTADKECQVVVKILERARTAESRRMSAVMDDGVRVPIVDFSSATVNEFCTILHLFTTIPVNSKLKYEELMSRLSEFIPQTEVQKPSDPQLPSTKVCWVCKQQPHRHRLRLPRLGQMWPQKVCESCRDRSYHQDMEDWTETGLQFLKTGKLGQVRAALGCFAMALCSYAESTQPMLKLARELISQGLPEMAMPLLSTLLKRSTNIKESTRNYLLVSSALKAMSDQPNVRWHNQWLFLNAAKEAYLKAYEKSSSADYSLEVPELATKKSELDSALHAFVKQREHDYDCEVEMALSFLESAWHERNWEQLLAIMTEERDQQLLALTNRQDYIMEGFERFVAAKEEFLERMLPQDRFPIIFFRGVVKLSRKHFANGLADIENAVWNSHCANWLSKAAIDTVLTLLPELSEVALPLQAVRATCETLAAKATKSSSMGKSATPILPTADELNPPSEIQWPELCIKGINMKGTRKFEQAVLRQVKEGKWTEFEAALAFIDYFPACNHPAEVAICFLTASFWFLKELRRKASETTTRRSELYALKKAIEWCLQHTFVVTHLSLHPGMQLYVSRLALGTILSAAQLAGDLATPDDSELVIKFMRTLAYNCRFCPFWHAPTVGVSEAVLLNIITGRIHSEFILGLQHVQPEQCPIHMSELRYQLYENDLRGVHSLKDPAGARTRAMEEMLSEKGWSFEDVVKVMTSPLSPRTSEGWLVQQPTLGIPLEYAELKGFVLNMDSDRPSIQLLVEPADPHRDRVGLFSQADVDTVLQLDADKLFPVLFSLDPPNEDQRFHPFQQLRFLPDELESTDLLHTLFETDYLLKSFSVGAEVSALPPFNQRPSSESLTANLPPKLREALKPVAERGYSHNRINRFWIQADELVYDSTQSHSQLEFRIGKPKMVVRSHPLLPGPDGKLQDTADDHDPDSPEAQFAADLTAHYTELGWQFPMFARLRELVKLQFLGLILKSTLKHLEDMAEGCGVEVTDQMLHTIQQDARQQKRAQVEKMLRDVYQQVQSQASGYTYWEVSSSVISQVVDALMQASQHRLSRSTLRSYVSSWLSQWSSSSSQDQLADYICSSLPLPTRNDIRQDLVQLHRQRYNAFRNEVERLQRSAKRQAPGRPANSCSWVPAAQRQQKISEERFSLCYGGVLIAPEIRQGWVPSIPPNIQRVTLPAQTSRSAAFRYGMANRDYRGIPSTSGGQQRGRIITAPGAGGQGVRSSKPLSGAGGRGGGGNNPPSGGGGQGGRGGGGGGNKPPSGGGGQGGGGDGGDEPPSDDESQDGRKKYSFFKQMQHRFDPTKAKAAWRAKKVLGILVGAATVGAGAVYFAIVQALGGSIDKKNEQATGGTRTCDGPCKLCPFINTSQTYRSTATGKSHLIKGFFTCMSEGVIYLWTCPKTGKQYVGKTINLLRQRWYNHRYDIAHLSEKAIAEHCKKHGLKNEDLDGTLQVIDQTSDEKELSALEKHYIEELDTYDNGLNRTCG